MDPRSMQMKSGPGRKAPITIILLLVISALALGCGQDDKKKKVNQQCKANTDCADDICHRGICASPYPVDNGQPCAGNGNCKSMTCKGNICMGGKSPTGFACLNKEECESMVCKEGFCALASGKLDSGAPDAGVPDVGVADLAAPDAAVADAASPDSASPDAVTPDQAQPDASVPDQAIPDKTVPDQLVPDQVVPDQVVPDQAVPDQALPDQVVPDLPIPDIGLDSAPWDAGVPTVKDPGGIALTKDTTHPYKRQVAVTYNSGAGQYAAVWWHTTISKGYIAGARVDTSGKLLDSTPVTIYGGSGQKPSIASDGTNYMVVWEAGFKVWGTRLDKSLSSLDGPFGFQISAAGVSSQGIPVVRFDGTNYVVFWLSGGKPRGVLARRVSTGGKLLDASPVPVYSPAGKNYYEIEAAHNGSNFVVAWHENDGKMGDIIAARVDTKGGIKVLQSPASTTVAATAEDERTPGVSCVGASCLVSWQHQDKTTYKMFIKAALLHADGSMGKTFYMNTSFDYRRAPAVSSDGHRYMVAWGYGINSSNWWSDLYGARVSKTGKVLDTGNGFAISTGSNGQITPKLARGPGQYLAVWVDTRLGKYLNSIYAARIFP